MPVQLLDRQAKLLEHLTGAAGIFGAMRGLSNEPALQGLDLGLLHLEARFSHEKRMQKIEWALTETFTCLGTDRDRLVREFAEACPPTGISWIANARQFHDFLKARWRHENPRPAYLRDIAAYEMACAAVQAGERRAIAPGARPPEPGAIRRHLGAALLRCAYDIRPLLDGSRRDKAPEHRELRLAITLPPGADEPLVSALSSDLFDFLERIEDYVDPAPFAGTAGMTALISDLCERGLIEVER